MKIKSKSSSLTSFTSQNRSMLSLKFLSQVHTLFHDIPSNQCLQLGNSHKFCEIYDMAHDVHHGHQNYPA